MVHVHPPGHMHLLSHATCRLHDPLSTIKLRIDNMTRLPNSTLWISHSCFQLFVFILISKGTIGIYSEDVTWSKQDPAGRSGLFHVEHFCNMLSLLEIPLGSSIYYYKNRENATWRLNWPCNGTIIIIEIESLFENMIKEKKKIFKVKLYI